jgi:hypothetical protein
MSAVRSLSGVDRTPRLPPNSAENDPLRTFALGQVSALRQRMGFASSPLKEREWLIAKGVRFADDDAIPVVAAAFISEGIRHCRQ